MSERARLLALSDRELLAECEVDRYRASGPGGQKRNKTESAVRIRHLATGVAAHAAESRSQHDNRASALARLRDKLALDLREPVDLEDYRAPAELARMLRARLPRQGVAYLLGAGQLLDLFVATGCAVSEVAERLSVTTGAVSRLLTSDDRLLRRANELRAAAELRPLRP